MIGALLAAPAAAQFGGFFGDPPPRPPGSVPGGRQSDADPGATAVAGQLQLSAAATIPGQYRNGPGGSSGTIQSRPLPPPPGAAEPAPREPAAAALPPAQRQPRVAPQPADLRCSRSDEVVTAPPSQKIANKGALFSGLDKITGRIINFDVAIGETVQFGALQLTPRACYTRPPTETPNTDAFVEVDEVTLQGEIKRIFTGWMFAASPGLHAVEHPIYDIWLTDCKSPLVTAEQPAAEPAPAPAAAAAAAPAAAAHQCTAATASLPR